MDEFLNTTLGKSLRWLAVIPGAFLAMVLAPILFNLVIYVAGALEWRAGTDETFLFYLFRTFLSAGVGSFAYIYIGSIIAPFFRRIVSVSLCVIFITLYILLIFASKKVLGVIESDVFEVMGLARGWKLIVSALFFLAGSIIGVFQVWGEYGLED